MRNPFRVAALDSGFVSDGGGSSAYMGAIANRLTADWAFAAIESADQEIRGGIRTLRARARELHRNNELAASYVQLIEDQEIGHEGIRLQAYVKRPGGLLDMGINERIEEAWAEWCEKQNCTVDGRLPFAEVLALLAGNRAIDGEYLVRMLPTMENRFGFALQIFDPDQLDVEYNREPGNGKNEIRMGVEIDAFRRPVAYWVWDHHPSEYGVRGQRQVRIPADQILHNFRAGPRVNATRGVTWFHPALYKLKMLAGYEEGEVVGMRLTATAGGFFQTVPEAVRDTNAPKTDQDFNFSAEPGAYPKLPPGWTYIERDPKHPTDAYNEFHKAMIRGICAGLGVTYTSVTHDLSDVNYGSMRGGLLGERDMWRRWQWIDIRHFCQPVYRNWFRYAELTGALKLPDRNRARWSRHRWQPRGWPWIDPLKDVQAAALEVRLGVNSLTRICAERGLDFEEVLSDRAMEIGLARELGVDISTEISKSATETTPEREPEEPEPDARWRWQDEEDDEAPLLRRESRLFARILARRELAALNGNGGTP
jgi:lambda family phage portal protein